MERLFSPCTRLHDILESQGRFYPPEGFQELNLDVSTQELLSAERVFTYADLYAMLESGETVLWLTPHAAVAREDERVVQSWFRLREACSFHFHADGKKISAFARSHEHLLEICDVVLRLLAASVVHSVLLRKTYCRDGVLINAPTLAYLMEQCQSLKLLSLKDLEMDENHCRVLGAYSRPDLEIELSRCSLTSAGTSALAEVLGHNQGPTKLDCCFTDNVILADGLRGNSRVKSFIPYFSEDFDVGNREVLAIADAVREHKGLVEWSLRLYGCPVYDETWGAVCDSLKTHPTLEVLDLAAFGQSTTATVVTQTRIQALLDMIKVNMTMHTIRLSHHYRQHELFRGSVIPYLETNRLRAMQKNRPIPYRAKVLGRALLSARTDANSFWMLLSGNPDVAFSSTTATTTPAANLPTPASADATFNAATAAVTAAANWTALTAGASNVANVATPTACQKRKTCP
jgi:hypothetical protein